MNVISVLIIGYVWPEPSSSAAGSRMRDLIHLCLQNHWKITFATPASASDHAIALDELNIDTVAIQPNSETFDRFVTALQPNLVLFDRFIMEEQFGWRVAKYCPSALRILNTEDLHSLRKARQQALNKKIKFTQQFYLTHETTHRELASIYRCDLTLITSEVEIQILTRLLNVPEYLLHYFPVLQHTLSTYEQRKWPDFIQREHMVMVGNFRHQPNWDAILYLKQSIWPKVHKHLPGVQLHIYGAYMSQKAEQLHDPGQNFYVKGRADSASEVVRKARLCLAPLRFGAGLKGKLLEAMYNGTPSITSTIGIEGIAPPEKWPGAVADTASEFAEKTIHLYQHRRDWIKAQQLGIQCVSQFSKDVFIPKLQLRFNQLLKDLDSHRLKNATGMMIMHHSLKSTEYMSRWIETKNKLAKEEVKT